MLQRTKLKFSGRTPALLASTALLFSFGCGSGFIQESGFGVNESFKVGGLASTFSKIVRVPVSDFSSLSEGSFSQTLDIFLKDRLMVENEFSLISSQNGEPLNNGDSVMLQFQLDETPLCNHFVKAIRVNDDYAILGQFPENANEISHVPPESDALEMIATQMPYVNFEETLISTDLTVLKSGSCVAKTENEWVGALVLELASPKDQRYRAYVSRDGVIELTRLQFDVSETATIKAYDTNPVDGTISDFIIDGMSSSGYLENDYFTTSTADTKAYAADYVFDYETTDAQFDEVSIFAHANQHLEWIKNIGFEWYTADKLNLVAHAVISGTVNNALYTPASGSSPPKIQVGDGDGEKLQNLGKDSDVVAHELGHHIVYEFLQSVSGESLVLHEGLADFLAYSRTGDACLGESICPANSTLGCEVEAQCLRTGDNSYVLGFNTKDQAHFKSQFISGLLWDLRQEEFVTNDEFSELAYSAIEYLLPSSGYHDLVVSLLLADETKNEGANCEVIYSMASDRGLAEHISEFDCEDNRVSSQLLNNSGTSHTTVVTQESSSGTVCGVGAGAFGWQGSIFLYLLPLFGAFIRRRSNG